MDKIVKFEMFERKKGGKLLTVSFLQENKFSIKDKKLGKEVIEKYGKILTKFDKLHILIDTRKIINFSVELAVELVTDLIKYNKVARKNIVKTSIILCSPDLRRALDAVLHLYDFVVPTKIYKNVDDAYAYVEN